MFNTVRIVYNFQVIPQTNQLGNRKKKKLARLAVSSSSLKRINIFPCLRYCTYGDVNGRQQVRISASSSMKVSTQRGPRKPPIRKVSGKTKTQRCHLCKERTCLFFHTPVPFMKRGALISHSRAIFRRDWDTTASMNKQHA